MAGGSRPEKVEEWTERFKRFEGSSLTVARFCQAEGVGQQSYYHWRRKLRDISTGGASSPRASRRGRFQPVGVASNVVGVQPTTILLDGVRIELGSDLAVAELVVKHVLHAVVNVQGTEGKSVTRSPRVATSRKPL